MPRRNLKLPPRPLDCHQTRLPHIRSKKNIQWSSTRSSHQPTIVQCNALRLPVAPNNVNHLLLADDVTIYATIKRPIDSVPILQPFIEKVSRWGRKWKFKFSASKSSTVSLIRLYKPRDDPLLFLSGHRIPKAPKIKFLGLILDAKLLWKTNLQCLKNVLSIISKATYAPNIKSLCILFKS